jgi:TQXA domain-containing protein/LPXTG-motif cell wall-anchored protein
MAAVLVGGPALAAGATGTIGGGNNNGGAAGTFKAKVPGEKEFRDYTAGRITIKIGVDEKVAYCIDIHNELGGVGTEYEESGWKNSGVKNLDGIKWVLTHGFSDSNTATEVAAAAGLPTDTANLENLVYAGTQAAIWHFSDDLEMSTNPAGSESETIIRKVYTYLEGKAANAGKNPEPAPTLKITPDKGTGTVGSLSGPYTVQAAGGEITLTATGGKVVNESGNPITSVKAGGKFWVSADGEGEVKVTAAGEVTVPVGRVFVHGEDQKIILAGEAKAKASAELKITFGAAPLLPVTGASVAVMVGVGLVLLVAGSFAVFTLRRRRVRFTAA